MHVWTNQVCFKKSALFTGIQASPPQKQEMKEAPVSVQSSPLQGQNVLSFSPARPSSTSPKFSPSCVSGFSPPLSSSSAGGPFSPSMVFDQVEYFEMLKLYFWYFILFTHPLLLHLQVLNYSPSPSSSPYPSNLGPAEGTSLRARYRSSRQSLIRPEVRRTTSMTWRLWRSFYVQRRRKATAVNWVRVLIGHQGVDQIVAVLSSGLQHFLCNPF